jgi:preprotein translocase subunit SecF
MANKTSTYDPNSQRTDKSFGKFDFVKAAPIMGGVSLLLTIIALVLIFTKGLVYGIDFAGGTEMQVRFDKAVEASALRDAVASVGVQEPNVQAFGSDREFLIRLETPHAATEKEANSMIMGTVEKIKTVLKEKFQMQDSGVLRVDTVGPQIGSELKRNGFLAAFYSFLVILIYVGIRFDYKYAPGAVICLVHDSIVTVGVFSLLGREFNVQIMAAVLTLIGYSLNDTIVTFDRIRETTPHYRGRTTEWIINRSINDMLGRTILTASATMIAVLGLYFFGGGVISEIAFTLIIGIIVGTYSSIYVAAPLVLIMEKFGKNKATA